MSKGSVFGRARDHVFFNEWWIFLVIFEGEPETRSPRTCFVALEENHMKRSSGEFGANTPDIVVSPDLPDLPDELWCYILGGIGGALCWLNYQYCIRRGLLHVNKRWHRLILITTTKLKRLYGLTEQHLVQLAPSLTSLDLSHGSGTMMYDAIESVLPLLTNLKQLKCGGLWSNAPPSITFINLLSQTLTSLRSIDASHGIGASRLVQSMTWLQDLTLSLGRCGGNQRQMDCIVGEMTGLTRLVSLSVGITIDYAALIRLTRLRALHWWGDIKGVVPSIQQQQQQQQGLTNLTSLKLRHYVNNNMDGLLSNAPNLTELDIGGSLLITDTTLMYCNSSSLTSLCIRNCPLVTDNTISRLTSLTALKIGNDTPGVTCHSLVCLPRLERLVAGIGITGADLIEMGSRLSSLTYLMAPDHLLENGVGALWRTLSHLCVEGGGGDMSKNRLDTLLQSEPGLPYLTALVCDYGVRLSDTGLARCASRLVALRVQSNFDQLTDTSLLLCTALQSLSIPYCERITGASVSTLTNLHTLSVAHRSRPGCLTTEPINITHVMALSGLTELDKGGEADVWSHDQLCRLPSLSDLYQSQINHHL